MTDAPNPADQISYISSGIWGTCPECKKPSIFTRIASLKPRCDHCNLNLAQHDNGDGPSNMSLFVVGGLVCILALWVEFSFSPSYWVHIFLWIPFTTLTTLLSLRFFKGVFLASQYKFHLLKQGADE